MSREVLEDTASDTYTNMYIYVYIYNNKEGKFCNFVIFFEIPDVISHVRLFMIISQSPIIASGHFRKRVAHIINRKIHRCLEIPDLFLVLNMIFLNT